MCVCVRGKDSAAVGFTEVLSFWTTESQRTQINQALDTQTIIVSRIKSLLILFFLLNN